MKYSLPVGGCLHKQCDRELGAERIRRGATLRSTALMAYKPQKRGCDKDYTLPLPLYSVIFHSSSIILRRLKRMSGSFTTGVSDCFDE